MNVLQFGCRSVCVCLGVLRQRMRDAGFVQLVAHLCNHGDATVNTVAASVSLTDDDS